MAFSPSTAANGPSRRASARAQPPPPVPAYLPTGPCSPLVVDKAVYAAIQSAPRTSTQSFTVPVRSGRAWTVPAGSIVRISTPFGPQVGDLNIWHLHNPRERFWASRTKQLHASHVSTFDRLWSCLPYMRPLATIVADTLDWYGTDENGGRVHDLLGTRCDPYINSVLTDGQGEYDYHCHSNLTRAVMEFGLTETDVHDVINLFQVTGLDREHGRYFMSPCPAQAGDYIEFLAEVDLLMALSEVPPPLLLGVAALTLSVDRHMSRRRPLSLGLWRSQRERDDQVLPSSGRGCLRARGQGATPDSGVEAHRSRELPWQAWHCHPDGGETAVKTVVSRPCISCSQLWLAIMDTKTHTQTHSFL